MVRLCGCGEGTTNLERLEYFGGPLWTPVCPDCVAEGAGEHWTGFYHVLLGLPTWRFCPLCGEEVKWTEIEVVRSSIIQAYAVAQGACRCEPERGLGWLRDAQANVYLVPACNCTACGCSRTATTTDDLGIPVCSYCAEYIITDEGDVLCSRCEGYYTKKAEKKEKA